MFAAGEDVWDVAADNPMLTDGWWAVEQDASGLSRWTGGRAILPSVGGMVLEVELAGTMQYPVGISCQEDDRPHSLPFQPRVSWRKSQAVG